MEDYPASHRQSSLDRKLLATDDAHRGYFGCVSPHLAESLQAVPGDNMAHFHKKQHTEAAHLHAHSTAYQPDSSVHYKETNFIPFDGRTTGFSPDTNKQQGKKKQKKSKKKWEPQSTDLSVIEESVRINVNDDAPLVMDKQKKRDNTAVAAAAIGGSAAVSAATHSAGMMATSAAVGGCCGGTAAKTVSIVMFVSVVASVGYAGYKGVVTALTDPLPTAVLTTWTSEMTTPHRTVTTDAWTSRDADTTSAAIVDITTSSISCPLSIHPSLYSLLMKIQDDGRCQNMTEGFYASEESCSAFFHCDSIGNLSGEGECLCGEFFSPNSLSCEYQNNNYYRDAIDCNVYHRCWFDGVVLARSDNYCNVMEYFDVRNPVSPVCARKEDVDDCPLDTTTLVRFTTDGGSL